jgi:hypothetical protein
MARFLAENSYDTHTLAGMPITFRDGCRGLISVLSHWDALILSVPDAAHIHRYALDWPTVAWSYIDKGRKFPAHRPTT